MNTIKPPTDVPENVHVPSRIGVCLQCGAKGHVYFYHDIPLCDNCWVDSGLDGEDVFEEYS